MCAYKWGYSITCATYLLTYKWGYSITCASISSRALSDLERVNDLPCLRVFRVRVRVGT